MRLFLVAALVLSSVSFAQTSPGAQQRKAPTSTIIFGDEDLVEGTTKSPDLGLVTGRQPIKHPSLIQLRDSFSDKLKDSVNDLR